MEGNTYSKNNGVLLYATNGAPLTIRCLEKLLHLKSLKGYNIHVPTTVASEEEILGCDNLLRELNQRLFLYNADITSAESIKETVEKVIEIEGKIDVLICHIIDRPSPKLSTTTTNSQIQTSYEKNLYPNIAFATNVIRHMKKAKSGKIICINSIVGLNGMQYYSVYSATRFALEGYLESVAVEMSTHNISISILEIALEKKTEVNRALDRAASFYGQMDEENNNNAVEKIAQLEEELIKGRVMKELHAGKLTAALEKFIKSNNSNIPFRKYLNKSCLVGAKEKYSDPFGTKKINELSKFFLCVDLECKNEEKRKTCLF